MKKKNLICNLAMAALVACSLVSCNDSNKMDEKPSAAAASQAPAPSGLKIAFVEVDSIMSQYNFCKDYSKILEKRANNSQSALASQEKNLQAAVQNFQNKLQSNGFSSQQEAQLLASRDRLASELQSQTDKFNEALHDSLEHFIAKYNKDKKYSMIFAKQGDNMLYADKGLDITAEVVAGLNKAYKGNIEGKK